MSGAGKNKKDEKLLLAELYRRPGFLFRRAHQITAAIFADEVDETGLTATQFGVLYILNVCEPQDQISVARMVGLDRSTTGYVVGTLEGRGLIQRQPDPNDGRRRVLSMTKTGREIFARARECAARVPDRILEPFSADERTVLIDLMERLVDALNDKVRTPIVR